MFEALKFYCIWHLTLPGALVKHSNILESVRFCSEKSLPKILTVSEPLSVFSVAINDLCFRKKVKLNCFISGI